jgi:hypothetical protein
MAMASQDGGKGSPTLGGEWVRPAAVELTRKISQSDLSINGIEGFVLCSGFVN